MPVKDRTLTNIIYRLSSAVILLFITILISRISGPETFGILSLFVLNATFLNLVTSFGSDSSITFHSATGSMEASKLLRFIYILFSAQIIIAVIAVVFFWFYGEGKFLVGAAEIKYYWLWCIYLLSISIVEKYGALMNGSQLFTLHSKITLTTNGLFFFVLLVWFVFNIETDPFSIIAIYVLFTFIQAAVMFFSYSGRSSISSSALSMQDYRKLLRYSVMIFIGNIIQFLAYRVGLWVIDWYNSDVGLGLFALAGKMSQLIWLLPVVFATLLFPKVSRERQQFDHRPMLVFIRIMNIINVIIIVLAVMILRWLVTFVAGDAYSGSVLPILILLPGTALFCITSVLAAYFAGTGKLSINLYGSALCLLLVVIFNFVLVPIWGINGAALASSIGYAMVTIYFIAMYLRDSGTRLSQMLVPGKEDFRFLTTTIRSAFEKQSK